MYTLLPGGEGAVASGGEPPPKDEKGITNHNIL